MKDKEFELKILLKQNKEMSTKLQWYRRQNQELSHKNDQLNTWVENLSEVFAAVSGAWQSITTIEQTLLTLMKKKSDMKDKTVLGKYISHFKAFSDIINNLGDKIKNPGHSDESSLDAKTRLNSFVKNYQMFFKEFVDTYFKFNEQYSQGLNQLKNKPDIPAFTRNIAAKELENRQKVQEFINFMGTFKENFKIYEAYNQHALLDNIIKKKQEEIQKLKNTLYQQQRRVKVFFDYNQLSIQKLLQKTQEDLSYECYCGGAQLSYVKKIWEQGLIRLKQNTNNGVHKTNSSEMKDQSKEKQANEEKIQELEREKKSLIDRNAILLEKIQKMKIQYKVTDQMILKSSIYQTLKEQCQYLFDYCNDLLIKLKKNEQYMSQLQKQREEELKTMKKKLQKQSSNQKQMNGPTNNVPLNSRNVVQMFKTNIITQCQELRKIYRSLVEKNVKPEQMMLNSKRLYLQLKKQNEQVNRKAQNMFDSLSKRLVLEFRHQKFKEIQNKVSELLRGQNEQIQQLWKQFIGYVKGRDKKIKDLQSMIRKKQKQVQQKQKLEEIMKESLGQTEKVYLSTKQKLQKTEQFIEKVQTELGQLGEENFRIKTEYEQQNNLLNLKLKAQTQVRNKLQQKVSLIDRFESQINQIRETQEIVKKNYEGWIKQQKQACQQNLKVIGQQEIKLKSNEIESQEKQKQLTKLTGEKQALKSQIRQLRTRLQGLIQKSEDEILKLELEDYKGKIMCSCTGDRERQVALKTCSHLFCKKCIQDTQHHRNRKCPNCGVRFTKSDIHQIRWN